MFCPVGAARRGTVLPLSAQKGGPGSALGRRKWFNFRTPAQPKTTDIIIHHHHPCNIKAIIILYVPQTF